MRKTIGKTMMGIAATGAVVTMFSLVWLASGVMDSWASKENLDELPSYAKQIGYAAVVGCCCTMCAVAGHALAASERDGPRDNPE